MTNFGLHQMIDKQTCIAEQSETILDHHSKVLNCSIQSGICPSALLPLNQHELHQFTNLDQPLIRIIFVRFRFFQLFQSYLKDTCTQLMLYLRSFTFTEVLAFGILQGSILGPAFSSCLSMTYRSPWKVGVAYLLMMPLSLPVPQLKLTFSYNSSEILIERRYGLKIMVWQPTRKKQI